MPIRVLSEHEAWNEYAYHLGALGDNMPQFMRDGAEYRLCASDATVYDEILRLEYLLRIGR